MQSQVLASTKVRSAESLKPETPKPALSPTLTTHVPSPAQVLVRRRGRERGADVLHGWRVLHPPEHAMGAVPKAPNGRGAAAAHGPSS